jgi:ABC-type transport system involved in cytochrome c biogenesis ATPase subunit
MDDIDRETVLRLIAGAIAYRAGHLSAQDSHREQAEAVLTALQHNGYLQ